MADKNCSMCGGKGYYCEFSTLETCWCVEPATKADEASDLRTEVAKLKRLIAERWKPEVERLRKVEALQKQVNEHYKRWYRECIDEPFDTWLKDDATHWIGEQDAAFQAWQYLHENKIWLMKERIEEHEQERDRLKAENEALREKLNDCAISLHGEMLQKYGGQMPEDMHPVTRRNYDRDMAEVEEYRAALEGGADDRP